ncbi:MAG: DUF637 domain-containing protein [Arcobacter sp.]|uniref:DUF637 domain-containing protein n=1 Tax=Arcobacter sp. TaxID=1872629 RepID=UPI003B002CC5
MSITGNSFKLNTKALVLGAISAGVMSYASSMIDSSLGLDKLAKTEKISLTQQVQRGVANTVVKSGVNSAVYGTDFEDSLKTGLVTDISNVGFRYVGDTSMFKAYADGSLEKVALHSAVGATTAALLGEDIKAGAIAAGVNELASPLLDGIDNERQLALSGLIGGLSAGAVGGEDQIGMGQIIAQSGTEFNRQLHAKEKALIENNAEAYSKEKGISLTQAKKELYSILMYYNDKEYQNNVFLGLSDEQKQAGLIPVIGDKVQLNPAEMFKTINALALQSKDKTIGGFYKGVELHSQPILSSTQEQFNNSSVDFKTPDAMVDPAYFIPFGKVGTTVVKATETIGSKSISVVAQKTGQLYDNVTLGVIGQANKFAPNLTGKYLANPLKITGNSLDYIESAFPGIPANSKWGTRGFLTGYGLEKYIQYTINQDNK